MRGGRTRAEISDQKLSTGIQAELCMLTRDGQMFKHHLIAGQPAENAALMGAVQTHLQSSYCLQND